MNIRRDTLQALPELLYREERVDLAAAFRWAARLNMHEAVANHFSLAVDSAGKRFLINPNQRHFSLIKASDLLLLDADDPGVLDRPDAPDPTAWGLHAPIHRHCPHARCIMHIHSIYGTVLSCLADSALPAIDQNTATFYNRYVVDEDFGGLAFEEEGKRCATLLNDPKQKVMIMGNHGILVIGDRRCRYIQPPLLLRAGSRNLYQGAANRTRVTHYPAGNRRENRTGTGGLSQSGRTSLQRSEDDPGP